MAKWEITNVNIAGVSMAVPEHTVKTADIDLFTQEEADVFDKTVGIKSRHIEAKIGRASCRERV